MLTQELEEINALAEQVLEDSDLFLVETELRGSAGNRVISLFVESEAGHISLNRCAELSREIKLLLDAAGWRDSQYTLNVSSPGVDRPLKDFRQYINNKGRNASVVFEKDGERIRVEGKITDAKPEVITLETENKTPVEIPFGAIEETRIKVSFK
ncbi:hypothetical protein QA596_04070 [Balneolales bacterium ANBcel1]|nr:hypothetical protein [Balneolales bacterium ANBcel1]